jgi:hypothetical protein
MSMSDLGRVCTFCLRHESRLEPFCPENPGHGCTYGLHHEYPIDPNEKPKAAGKKPDKSICTKCSLHMRNPASATNGCVHEYPV